MPEQATADRLDVIPLSDGYRTVVLYVRGHVDLEAAREAMVKEFPDLEAGMGAVAHDYWRWVPYPPGDEFDMYAVYGQKPGRGAFPVTACRVG